MNKKHSIISAVSIAATMLAVVMIMGEYSSITASSHITDNKNSPYRTMNLDHPLEIIARDKWVAETDFMNDFGIHPHEVLVHHIQKERLSGGYAATDHERKYHDWLLSTYAHHDTFDKSHDAILAVLGSVTNLDRVDTVYDHLNTNANYGLITSEAFAADPDYWLPVLMVSECTLDTTCDLEALQLALGNNRELTAEELEQAKAIEAEDDVDHPDAGSADDANNIIP